MIKDIVPLLAFVAAIIPAWWVVIIAADLIKDFRARRSRQFPAPEPAAPKTGETPAGIYEADPGAEIVRKDKP